MLSPKRPARIACDEISLPLWSMGTIAIKSLPVASYAHDHRLLLA